MALTLFLASVALGSSTAPAAEQGVASSRIVDARGTASVRIVKSHRLTRETLGKPVEGASQRQSWLTDRDGVRRAIALVEFE